MERLSYRKLTSLTSVTKFQDNMCLTGDTHQQQATIAGYRCKTCDHSRKKAKIWPDVVISIMQPESRRLTFRNTWNWLEAWRHGDITVMYRVVPKIGSESWICPAI